MTFETRRVLFTALKENIELFALIFNTDLNLSRDLGPVTILLRLVPLFTF